MMASYEFLKVLDKGETIVMSDSISIFGDTGKLVLTNKRLLFCGTKGILNREAFVKKEIALKDIANVSGDIGKAGILGVTGNSWLVVEPKSGREWRCGFLGVGMAMWDYNMAQTQAMSRVNNWVASIKLELLKIAK